MKWKVRILKPHKRIILTYIDKYGDDDAIFLCNQINIQLESYNRIIFELYKNGYLNVQENKYIITDKGSKFILNSLNSYICRETITIQSEFEWNELYIPQNMLL